MPRPSRALSCFAFTTLTLACADIEARPLTVGDLVASSSDTLTIIVDFDRTQFPDVEDSIRSYWTAFPHIDTVCFTTPAAYDPLSAESTLLYGTLETRADNPVFGAFRDTWLGVLEQEAPNLADADQTGVIAVGMNPFASSGFIGVFGAISVDFLPGLHAHYDSLQSLVIVFQGRVEQTALYDTRFRKIMPEIARDEALQDIQVFFDTIEQVHPQPLLHLSPESYLDLKQGMPGRLGLEDTTVVSKTALAVELAKAAAALGDGHTSVRPSAFLLDQTDPNLTMLPLYMRYSLDGLCVASTTTAVSHLENRRLVAIEGQPVLEYLAPVLEAISGERTANKLATFISNQQTYWALLAPRSAGEIELTTVDRSGSENRGRVSLISLADHDQEFHEDGDQFQTGDFHEYHHNQRTCYYRFDSFQNSEEQLAYADSLFAELDRTAVQNLVIDLRFNSGGNSNFGDYLLDYLTREPYRKAARMDVRLSELLFNTYEGYREFEGLTGMTISRRVRLEQPEARGIRFDGKLYVLVGPGTFSSAGMFAAMVKDFQLGTLIGEETGATRECFGEVLNVRLPNSDLKLNVSCKRWFAPVPQFDDSRRGTVPDIPVDDGVLESYPEAEDPVLSFALDHLARHTE
jgi:hypothetical protein